MIKFILGISVTLNLILIFGIYLFFRYTRYKRDKQQKRAYYRDSMVEDIDNIKMDIDFWGGKI